LQRDTNGQIGRTPDDVQREHAQRQPEIVAWSFGYCDGGKGGVSHGGVTGSDVHDNCVTHSGEETSAQVSVEAWSLLAIGHACY
jgi:hypothetical protein